MARCANADGRSSIHGRGVPPNEIGRRADFQTGSINPACLELWEVIKPYGTFDNNFIKLSANCREQTGRGRVTIIRLIAHCARR